MSTIRKIFALVTVLAFSTTVNTYTVASGSFKKELAEYQKPVAVMMHYAKYWDSQNSDQEKQIKVVDWMKKRINNQDIPAILLIEITQLLLDTKKNDGAKIQGMFDIIEKNKEARHKIKQKRKMAKVEKQHNQQKKNEKARQNESAHKKQHVIQLVQETAIKTVVQSAITMPALIITNWFITNYIGA